MPIPMSTKKLSTEIAYQYIRKKILSGEYQPGQPLASEIISVESGTSRTPVRDALRRLEADGLVAIRPRSGASVKMMDAEEFIETCDLRLALESHAAARAAKYRTDSDLHEMKVGLEEMRALVERIRTAAAPDPGLVTEIKREDVHFHIAIMTAARSELIKKQILRLHIINRLIAGPTALSETTVDKSAWDQRRQIVLASHDQIYTAIEKSDSSAARRAMEEHIQDFLDVNLRYLKTRRSGVIISELTDERAGAVQR